MEPVNFQCGHCGNLMGVEAAFLGQQVRCPHCQQIVIAPAPAPETPTPQDSSPDDLIAPSLSEPATPEPISAFDIPQPTDQDSIFSADDSGGDGLFDDPLPQVEMPPDVDWPTTANDEPQDSSPFPEARPSLEETFFTVPQAPVLDNSSIPAAVEEGLPISSHVVIPSGEALSAPMEHVPVLAPVSMSPSVSGSDALASVLPAPAVRMPRTRPWLVPMLIIPLISYSILATIAAALLYVEKQKQNLIHPLEMIPDQGDNKGASRTKSSTVRLPLPTEALPDRLKVELGKSIQIGDLEVTPERVERRQIQYESTRKNAAEDTHLFKVLALVLRLRNISNDVIFKPMDPYFTRQWRPRNTGMMPYTYLALGDQKTFCGPLSLEDMREHRLQVVGQDLNRELQPGQEMVTFVCTDPEDPNKQLLDQPKDKDPLLWRVQVRRGLVQVRDRDISATAVIGVEFSSKNIE